MMRLVYVFDTRTAPTAPYIVRVPTIVARVIVAASRRPLDYWRTPTGWLEPYAPRDRPMMAARFRVACQDGRVRRARSLTRALTLAARHDGAIYFRFPIGWRPL